MWSLRWSSLVTRSLLRVPRPTSPAGSAPELTEKRSSAAERRQTEHAPGNEVLPKFYDSRCQKPSRNQSQTHKAVRQYETIHCYRKKQRKEIVFFCARCFHFFRIPKKYRKKKKENLCYRTLGVSSTDVWSSPDCFTLYINKIRCRPLYCFGC